MSLIIGVTGPSGSGKSTFCALMAAKGYPVLDCDALCREVQRPGSACLAQLEREFSKDIILSDGSLDRRGLARLCFADAEKLKKLDGITHPHILALLDERLKALKNEPAVLVEAAALFESGLDKSCDRIIGVLGREKTLQDRIMARDGITREQAQERLAAQFDSALLRRRADHIILNDGSETELAAAADFTENLIKSWIREGIMAKDKKKSEELAEKLLCKRKSCFELFSEDEQKAAREFAKGYMGFLGDCRTERECVEGAVELLCADGFSVFDPKKQYKAGDRVYFNNRGKSLVAAIVGSEPAEDGFNIVASHVDSPRLDLKPNPLYEDNGLALFKTHYYGGIKKYQWTAIPLSLRGVVVDKDGKEVKVNIGGDKDDPVLYITNLLPHLSGSHAERKNREVVKGEELNILMGSVPFDTDKDTKEAIKLNVMRLINEKYGFTEGDFVSAELEVVPAFEPRYVGLDRALIAAYGHDDRVCAYPSLMAFVSSKPGRTALCVFADKEETGSEGNTGLQGAYLEQFVIQLAHCMDAKADPITVLQRSTALSSDVTAALDPTYPDVMEARNCSRLNYGPSVDKYGGHSGKAGCNDASAEYMGRIKNMLDKAGVPWQTGELGKVDEGGGGTVAMYIAKLGVDIVDCGVPMLSMHSPYELASVYDIYAFYRCCEEFYRN